MIKSKKHIEIVRSTVSCLSSMSQESCDNIFDILNKYYTNIGVTVVNNLTDLEGLVACRPDLVFLGMEFIPLDESLGLADPSKIWLSSYFDQHNIVYTGSNQIAHKLTRYKHLAKAQVLESGLKTSLFFVQQQNQPLVQEDLTLEFPLFVKPNDRGGGLGIDNQSVVYDFLQLDAKVKSITTNLKSDALIEEYLSGREFSVAILKKHNSPEFSVMPLELIAPIDPMGIQILSSQVKSANAEQAIAVIDKNIKSQVIDLAMKVFETLSARDYGRIDIRFDQYGEPQFLEANLIPSLISGYGSFPKACVINLGLDYESMIIRIVQLGLARSMDI